VCASKIMRKGGFLQTAFSRVHSYENPFSRCLKKMHHAKGFLVSKFKTNFKRDFVFKR
jgi:hypothetical protein